MKSNLFLVMRRFWILLANTLLIAVSLSIAFLLRFDFTIPASEIQHLWMGLALVLPIKMLVFSLTGLHRGWWKLVGMPDLVRVLLANLVGFAGFATASWLLQGNTFPRSVYFIDFIVCFLGTGGMRFAVRFYNEVLLGQFRKPHSKNLLIYGAGQAGITLLRELRANPKLGRVVGFLDDDPRKRKLVLLGLPVLGKGRDIPRIVTKLKGRGQEIEEIVLAIPSATGRQIRDAVANAKAAGVKCKILPTLGEMLTGKVLSAQIRDLSVGDLLGREAVQLETNKIWSHIASKVVMVTGGAGSIGSELCRQLAKFDPKCLIIFDQAESELYKIDLELRSSFPALDIIPAIGDIQDPERIDSVIRNHQVDSVFHAAAYKHVPMMESHLLEAVKNNVLGTWNVIEAAARNRVNNFLMISSDKAVNPTTIMGLTKRAAEVIVSAMPVSEANTRFVSVRFGNVLGSNGSVVPRFKEQIAAGGPVTVTHPDMRRYFMTIPEATQLVLQASTMGTGGSEIFVLEMGEPVRIVDLARNMIRLSGFEPDEDIEIRFIGLRPGEKLSEELMLEGEHLVPTGHNKIHLFRGPGQSFANVETWLGHLRHLLELRDENAILAHLTDLVPEYQPKTKKMAAKERGIHVATAARF